MQSNDDDAFIQHTRGPAGVNQNGIGEVLDKSNGFGDDCPRLSATLVGLLEATGDPRLSIFGVPAENTGAIAGMPNGLDETTIQTNPTGTSTGDFSRINPAIVLAVTLCAWLLLSLATDLKDKTRNAVSFSAGSFPSLTVLFSSLSGVLSFVSCFSFSTGLASANFASLARVTILTKD